MKARYGSLQPLLLWQRVAHPVDWVAHFGRQTALEVEIGFGNGEFLARRAQECPDRDFVGIEVEWESVQRGLRRLHQAGLSNVRLLLVDARIALERLFGLASIARAYALFPCPWPKERHSKHRLFTRTFLQLLNSRLQAQGEVQLVTDFQPYAQWVLAQLEATGFEAQCTTTLPRFQTKYERKWQDSGQQEFYDLRLQKIAQQAFPLPENRQVQTHRVDIFDPERFPLGTVTRGAITVAYKEWLYDPLRHRGMAWVVVAEDGLTQDFWIEVVRTEERWIIRPARGCGIVPTLGVQQALDLLRDAAVALRTGD